MSFTWASHIAAGMLTIHQTLPNQSTRWDQFWGACILTPGEEEVFERGLAHVHAHHTRYSTIEEEALGEHTHEGHRTTVDLERVEKPTPYLQTNHRTEGVIIYTSDS